MKKVLVTGISGYIGQHCAAELIKNGYAVRGSLRSLSKAEAVTQAIQTAVDPKGNLEYCELDLLNDSGWDKAMQGCDFVLHVASPFVIRQPKDENELINPAVEGTQRALKAAKKAGIKRVVLTSSMVAMLGEAKGNLFVNHDSWTNVKAKGVSAYVKSKTLAEKKAWEYIKKQKGDQKLELVTIHPGPVYGPSLSENLTGESMSMFKDIIAGKMPLIPKSAINMSDVRDVAEIHVKALEDRKASGKRFIVSSENAHTFQALVQILKNGGYDKVSTKLAPNFFLKFMAKFNKDLKGMLPFIGNTFTADISETMKVFNWKPIPFQKTILDTASAVKAVMDK